MTIKQILIIVVYGIVCFVLSLAFVRCSERDAQNRVKKAEIEASEAKATLNMALSENARLSENMAKYDAVLKQAITAIERAYYDGTKRNEQIHNDVPDDWLQCELPTELQDVFGAYCDSDADSCDEATGSSVDSVR